MQITIHGLSPELEHCIQRLAAEENISINKAALKLLAKGAGLAEKRRVNRPDLDHLSGTWKASNDIWIAAQMANDERMHPRFLLDSCPVP